MAQCSLLAGASIAPVRNASCTPPAPHCAACAVRRGKSERNNQRRLTDVDLGIRNRTKVNGRCYSVLIADDSDSDRSFLKIAIETHAPRLRILGELSNGAEVMAYLSGQGQYADRQHFPLPDVLILDSRMPFAGGIEVLRWLQTHPCPGLMVAVMADTSGTSLQSEALELGAHFFFSKLASHDELSVVVQTLQMAIGTWPPLIPSPSAQPLGGSPL